MIKLYSAISCFHCADAKRKLKEKGIEFEELDAVDHLDYLTSLGRPQLPIITRDGELVELKDLIN
jgi:glutaredoxin